MVHMADRLAFPIVRRAPTVATRQAAGLISLLLRYLLSACLLTAGGPAQADNNPAKPLVVGSEQDYPPFATGITDQTIGGFTAELWKATEPTLEQMHRR